MEGTYAEETKGRNYKKKVVHVYRQEEEETKLDIVTNETLKLCTYQNILARGQTQYGKVH